MAVIIMQTEKYGKCVKEVYCKRIRMRPQETPTGTDFVRIGFPLYQIILGFGKNPNDPNSQIKLKWNSFVTPGKFVIHYRPSEDEPKGAKEEFHGFARFKEHCLKRYGKELTEQILGHFTIRVPECCKA